ncbi:MAG: 7-cyano-7-deazaguanine synthase [Chloroherpetonaceae bacterium]
MNSSYVLLLSGGLDSSSLLFWALKQKYNLFPLFVNYGQPSFPGEYLAIQNLLGSVYVPEVKLLDVEKVFPLAGKITKSEILMSKRSQYFPSRNLLLLSLAAIYAYQTESTHILIGLIGDVSSTLPDCSRDFIDKAESLLRIEYPKICIDTPFIYRSKISIVREAIQNGLKPEITFCCNLLPNHHCWKCPSCVDRFNIFKELGMI